MECCRAGRRVGTEKKGGQRGRKTECRVLGENEGGKDEGREIECRLTGLKKWREGTG